MLESVNLQALILQVVDVPDGREFNVVAISQEMSTVVLTNDGDEEYVAVEVPTVSHFVSVRVTSSHDATHRVTLDPEGATLADAAVRSEFADLVLDTIFDIMVVNSWNMELEIPSGRVLGRSPSERGFVERPEGGWELPSDARMLCALRVKERYDVGWILLPRSRGGASATDGAFLSLSEPSRASIRKKLRRIFIQA